MVTEQRLVNANAIKYREKDEYCGNGNSRPVRYVFDEDIAELPTVDAVEVVHGRWDDGICSVCDFDIRCLIDGESSFNAWVWEGLPHCPECGAKMDGGADRGKA